jgi:hypothetical protein
MYLPKPALMPLFAALFAALSACGGSGPIAVDVDVPTPDTTTEADTGDTTSDPSISAPPIIDEVAPSLDELGDVEPDEIDPNDPVLLATLAAIDADETVISAAALVTNADGSRSVLTRDGLYARLDGSLTLSELATDLNNDVLGDYDNAASFSQADAVGIVGLATPIANMPVIGDASYEGGASGFVITGTNGIDLINGRSVVDVVFNVDHVTVTLNDFEGVSQISGLIVDSPVTEIQLSNAIIADGGFSGGTLTLFDDNGSVDITGSDTTTVAQGQFFGLDADGTAPDEVGGVILSEGEGGIVFGTFIAD